MIQKNEQKNNRDKMLKDIFDKKKFLTKKSQFNFNCNACGKCCHNQDILMGTYDILRLRREFQEPTMTLIPKYFDIYPGQNSKIPVCLLKFIQIPEMKITICPFLKPEFYKELQDIFDVCNSREEFKEKSKKIIKRNFDLGKTKEVCSIHQNSPEVCKLYPLGRGYMMDKDTKKQTIKFFKLEKEKLFCDESCYQCKNTVEDYLKANNLIDPEKEKLQAEYNRLISEFAELAIDQKENFKDYRILLLYLYNFDFVFTFQKLCELNTEAQKRIINSVNYPNTENKKVLIELIEEMKQYKDVDTDMLINTIKKDATEQELKDFFRHLLDVYNDLLIKLKRKYAKGI